MDETQKKIEDAISQAILKFHKEQMGESPEKVLTSISGKTICVQVFGGLCPAEVELMDSETGRRILNELKGGVFESAKPLLRVVIKELTGIGVSNIYFGIGANLARYVIITLEDDLQAKILDKLNLF